ncbi:hypothetical protein NPIL_679141 [Nephila pilipes]|uniref:Uncharacterized protein n=1 Tax=Nephila pilipes TaxID=299642 RepID=A0A8X6NMI9_NEPPI|nr:hypothetical protein NPIL_679141 [Nephila pilipes]
MGAIIYPTVIWKERSRRCGRKGNRTFWVQVHIRRERELIRMHSYSFQRGRGDICHGPEDCVLQKQQNTFRCLPLSDMTIQTSELIYSTGNFVSVLVEYLRMSTDDLPRRKHCSSFGYFFAGTPHKSNTLGNLRSYFCMRSQETTFRRKSNKTWKFYMTELNIAKQNCTGKYDNFTRFRQKF